MRELEVLARRYGEAVVDLSLDRLVLKENRNRARRQVIEDQIDELAEELVRLRHEAERMALARDTLVRELADRIRETQGEGWSPTPVVGYRTWSISAGQVIGATGHPWSAPVLEAICSRLRPGDDLPHTDHVCSRVGYGCGIYAASDSRLLDLPDDRAWIVGIVLLTGKVVQHERGYRAARARVAGVVAHLDSTGLVTGDMAVLDDLFTDPEAAMARLGQTGPQPGSQAVLEALENLEREMEPWT